MPRVNLASMLAGCRYFTLTGQYVQCFNTDMCECCGADVVPINHPIQLEREAGTIANVRSLGLVQRASMPSETYVPEDPESEYYDVCEECVYE